MTACQQWLQWFIRDWTGLSSVLRLHQHSIQKWPHGRRFLQVKRPNQQYQKYWRKKLQRKNQKTQTTKYAYAYTIIHIKKGYTYKSALVYTNMGWLGDGSHRGQGCQVWTAVGLPPRYPQVYLRTSEVRLESSGWVRLECAELCISSSFCWANGQWMCSAAWTFNTAKTKITLTLITIISAKSRYQTMPRKILTASSLENWRRPLGRPRTMQMKTIQQVLKSNNLSLNEVTESSTLETDVYIWCYALLALGHARLT